MRAPFLNLICALEALMVGKNKDAVFVLLPRAVPV